MPALAETQALFRDAVVLGNAEKIAPLLAVATHKRFAIHRRNYQSSLVQALLARFPAVSWLVGTAVVTEAATSFVERFPPDRPCIAEYGDKFPDFLSTCVGNERVPYLKSFAVLEWHVGAMSLAIEEQSVTLEQLSSLDPALLPELQVGVQRSARYFQASWPVDELLKVYLSEGAPDRLAFDPAEVFLEIRGCRGEFRINRLTVADFHFRQSLAEDWTIGGAADRAMERDALFDAGASLIRIVAEGLVTRIEPLGKGDNI